MFIKIFNRCLFLTAYAENEGLGYSKKDIISVVIGSFTTGTTIRNEDFSPKDNVPEAVKKLYDELVKDYGTNYGDALWHGFKVGDGRISPQQSEE
ncbi:hypothetical protein [Flammeovirga sp. SJP92]|uniref:hypothetical protein n=1 Tax=Flammeovirga sp. SJP92 TaxID=1775430 RepID=UPI00078687B2|nr:hypothetical protein [Flammeovirga sp. SJP92]KXX70397.1 hypothetical protein AVL50_11610 [Flammeovirga sp. SJP92]